MNRLDFRHDWNKISFESIPTSADISLLIYKNKSSKVSSEEFNVEYETSIEFSKQTEHVIKEIKRSKRTPVILPGTKWCGAGNNSDHVDNLGYFNDTDFCCRQHDHCDEIIEGKGTKYGLKNEDLTTMSHCNCDDRFYSCLKKVNSAVSNHVGRMFFNILRKKCFRKDYPVKRCRKTSGILKRCEQYVFDRSKRRRWQIFEAREY